MGFFGDVFKVVIPGNLKAIVDHTDATDLRLNAALREYAHSNRRCNSPYHYSLRVSW